MKLVAEQCFKTNIRGLVNRLSNTGYVRFHNNLYFNAIPHHSFVNARETYGKLEKDPSHGNRYRAYSRFTWCTQKNTLVKDMGNDYFQSKEYNYEDGDKIRKFNQISNEFLNNSLVKDLMLKNIEFAQQSGCVTFTEDLEVGLHQIRYYAKPNNPSYSSPAWLHKDDEPLVFVHLFNLSQNAVGGDNLISEENERIREVFRLTSPLETFVVNQRQYHAVTPFGTSDHNPSYRDILLVTFFNNKQNHLAKAKCEEESSSQKLCSNSEKEDSCSTLTKH